MKKNLLSYLFCSPKNYKFWTGEETILGHLQRIIALSTHKIVIRLSKIWIWDPRSGIRKRPIRDPGSWSRGQKSTGSRIWICNTDWRPVASLNTDLYFYHCALCSLDLSREGLMLAAATTSSFSYHQTTFRNQGTYILSTLFRIWIQTFCWIQIRIQAVAESWSNRMTGSITSFLI